MTKPVAATFRIPTYLEGVRAAFVRPHYAGAYYPDDTAWKRSALEAMLGAYDIRYGRGSAERMEYVRPQSAVLVERKRVARYLDVAAAQRAAQEKKRPFEQVLLEHAERARPLGPSIDRVVPLPEQRLLAAIVAGDASAVFAALDRQPKALIKVYNEHTLLQALAFCPSQQFRRAFIERYRDRLNNHRRYEVAGDRNVSPFLRHQLVGVGHEVPGGHCSVYADLYHPGAFDSRWFNVALAQARVDPAVYARTGELVRRGAPLPPDAAHSVRRAARLADDNEALMALVEAVATRARVQVPVAAPIALAPSM